MLVKPLTFKYCIAEIRGIVASINKMTTVVGMDL